MNFARFRCSTLAMLACLCAAQAHGQTGAADRARLQTSQGPIQSPAGTTNDGVEQGYAAASPNDSDLGEQAILKRVEKYEPFTIETGVPIYYTSNIALVDNGRIGDTIIAPVVGITYSPKITKTLYGQFTLRQQFFYYTDVTSFNFASFDAIAGLVYYLPQMHNLVLRAGVDFNRLTGTDNFDSFFSDTSLGLAAEIPFAIGRAQQVSVGLGAAISLYATPSPPQRNDLGAYVGYSVNVARNLWLSASGRVVVRPYDSGSRTDVSEIIGLSADYRIRDWLTITALTTFVANQSNQGAFAYQVFNGGGGVTLSWKF